MRAHTFPALICLLIGLAFAPWLVASRNPDQIHLAILVSWQDVNSEDELSHNAQLTTLEIIADHMNKELGANVTIGSFLPSLGTTPLGHLYTVTTMHIDRKPIGVSRFRQQQQKTGRGMLAAVEDEDFLSSNVTADLSIRFLRDLSTESFLKQRIMNEVLQPTTNTAASNSKRSTALANQRRLLGYSGRGTLPRLVSILVEEEIRVEMTGGPRRSLKPKVSPSSSPLPAPQGTKVVATTTTTTTTNNNKNKKLSNGLAGTHKAQARSFQAKFFANGPDATEKVRTSSDARANLDRINQPKLPLDGNPSMPDIFFPPLIEADVYIMDTVVMTNHTEFDNRAEVIWDGFPDEGDELCESHGTHVTGTIGGRTVGVNRAARLYSTKVLNCEGFGYTTDLIAGALAINQHCTTVRGGKATRGIIVNMSFGGQSDPNAPGAAPFASVLALLRTNCDATLVAAAGNSAENTCTSVPGGYTDPAKGGVIAVGATDISDNLASFSNNGACIALSAPGVNIVSAGIASATSYVTMSGTSMASPLVAGVASLHLTRRPTFWDSMHASALFTDNIVSKMLSDAVSAVKSLPNSLTTARLLQVNARPILSTDSLPPVTPQAAPPSFMSSPSGATGLAPGIAALIMQLGLFAVVIYTAPF